MFDQLSPESLLLMYLAEELSEEQRTRFEQMLERDASLAAQLDELRDADAKFVAAMQRADVAARIALSGPIAVRKVARAMQQWQAERFQRPAVAHAQEARLIFPWWCYPLATAAAAVFALIVWVGNDNTESPLSVASGAGTEAVMQAEESWAVSAEPADAGPQPSKEADELNAAFGEQAG